MNIHETSNIHGAWLKDEVLSLAQKFPAAALGGFCHVEAPQREGDPGVGKSDAPRSGGPESEAETDQDPGAL